MTRSSQFLEYMKLHLISLRQDMEIDFEEQADYHYTAGQIEATRHLLSVALDIMEESERN
jgi:hypothetical protein